MHTKINVYQNKSGRQLMTVVVLHDASLWVISGGNYFHPRSKSTGSGYSRHRTRSVTNTNSACDKSVGQVNVYMTNSFSSDTSVKNSYRKPLESTILQDQLLKIVHNSTNLLPRLKSLISPAIFPLKLLKMYDFQELYQGLPIPFWVYIHKSALCPGYVNRKWPQ